MKKISLLLACITALSIVACSDSDEGENKCEKAAAVLKGCPGVEEGDGAGGECSGPSAAFAQCVLDYPDEACEDKGPKLGEYNDCTEKAFTAK